MMPSCALYSLGDAKNFTENDKIAVAYVNIAGPEAEHNLILKSMWTTSNNGQR